MSRFSYGQHEQRKSPLSGKPHVSFLSPGLSTLTPVASLKFKEQPRHEQGSNTIHSFARIPIFPTNVPVQRQASIDRSDEVQLLQRTAIAHAHSQDTFASRLQATRNMGRPLESGSRSVLESGLQADLSHVRVHTNSEADTLARAISADAFTTGTDIFFRSGTYRPATPQGFHLLTHEMTHVVQQATGPVSGTQYAGNISISTPEDHFEQEAETQARRLSSGASLAHSPDALAGRRMASSFRIIPGQSTAYTLQRKMGMEVETRIPVSLNGKKIEEYPHIAQAQTYHIDTDNGTDEADRPISILEFVMEAFDEQTGTKEQAKEELDRRLNAITAFAQEAANAPANTPLVNVADRHGAAVTGGYQQAQLNAVYVAPTRRLSGPVHFTIGFALEMIPSLIADKLTNPLSVKPKKPMNRAAQANVVANTMVTAQMAATMPRMRGYLALVYMQVAAVMDGRKEADRSLMKDRTQALSRVPLHLIFERLSTVERQWLLNTRDNIIGQMRDTYSGVAGKWGTHKKDNVLIPLPAKNLILAAFDGQYVNLVQEFGKMNVIDQKEKIDAERAGGFIKKQAYALELRRMLKLGDWRATAHQLLEYSRKVHRSDSPPIESFTPLATTAATYKPIHGGYSPAAHYE